MEAEEFLEQLKKLNKMIENKQAEKELLKSLALSITPQSEGERVQASSSQQKMADAIDRYIDLEKEIDNCIDILIDKKKEIIRVIEQLNTIEYDVLHKMYVGVINTYNNEISYFTLDDIAAKYDKSYSWAQKKHKKAVHNVQIILDAQKI